MMNVLFDGNVFITKGRWRMRELVARFGKAVKGMLGASTEQLLDMAA